MFVFIVGTGRSGTSLLQSMLASNSKIAYLPETLFFRRFVVNNGKGTKLNSWLAEKNTTEIADFLNNDRYFQRTDMNASDLLLQCEDTNFSNSPISLYRALLREKIRLEDCEIVGDKDPKSVEHLPVIYTFDNSAIVLQCVRDPRDVLVSRKKAEWSKGHSLIKHLFAIRIQTKLANRFIAKKSSNFCFLKVQYEKLISNPEMELRKICETLGIEFETNMLHFSKAAKSLVSNEEYSWKKETTKALKKDNSGNWPGVLSKYEIAMTESICRDVFVREGYEISKSLSALTKRQKLQIKIFQLIAMAADPIYEFLNRQQNRNAINAIKNSDGG